MKLSAIRAETRTTDIEFEGGTLVVTYRPHVLTADMVDQVNEAMDDPKMQTDGLFQMIHEVLISWDLEDDEEQIIDLADVPSLRKHVPISVFARIFERLQADQNPEKAGKR